jgi:type IV secretion system protein TrbL
VQATGNTMEGIGDRMTLLAAGLTTINIASPGVGAIITIFLAGLGIAGAGIVWFTLLIRKALLLVAIVFAPIALAGFTWDAAKGWFGRWAAFVVALIFSKLVIVVVFLVAIGQISAPIDLDLASISDPISGIVLMFIAAFAPYLTYKFISFVGFDMYHAMSSEQEAKSALNRPVPLPVKTQPNAAKSVLGGQDAARGGTPPAPSTAPAASGAAGGAAGSAGAGGGAAASGGGAAASGGAATAGAAAAGPAAAAVVGAQVVKAAATSGPKVGAAVGGAAAGQAETSTPPIPIAPRKG